MSPYELLWRLEEKEMRKRKERMEREWEIRDGEDIRLAESLLALAREPDVPKVKRIENRYMKIGYLKSVRYVKDVEDE